MSIFRRLIIVALAAAVLLSSPGCSKLRRFGAASTGDMSQWTEAKMTKVLSDIDAKIGGTPVDYVSVAILDISFTVQAIDPRKRENVDKYTYQDGFLSVKPVDTSLNAPGEVAAKAFRGDTVKPAVLARTMTSAPGDSQVENGKVELVSVNKYVANADPPQIHITVKGPRATKTAHYDLNGSLLKVTVG